jgi:hypothetical protein
MALPGVVSVSASRSINGLEPGPCCKLSLTVDMVTSRNWVLSTSPDFGLAGEDLGVSVPPSLIKSTSLENVYVKQLWHAP